MNKGTLVEVCYCTNVAKKEDALKVMIQEQTLQTGLPLLVFAEALERGHWRSRVGVWVVLLQRHADVVLEIERGLGVVGLRVEVHDQVVLDREDGVDVQVGIVAGVDLVDDGGVVGVGDHEVNVGGTHG